MGRGILSAQLSRFEEIGKRAEEKSAWKRREEFNLTYEFSDAIKSAFGLFLFRHLSMPGYQKTLDRGNQRGNAENIPQVKEIPCNNQITRLIDEVETREFDSNFKNGIDLAEKCGVLEQYKVLDLPRVSGFLGYDSSGRGLVPFIRKSALRPLSAHHEERENDLLSRHGGAGYSATRLGSGSAARPRDDSERGQRNARRELWRQKRDCERKAAKRLLEKHGEYYRELNATVPGDGLYANHATRKAVVDSGLSFIFTRKDESHPWIVEQIEYSEPATPTVTEWTGKYRYEHRYRRVNDIENRADGEKLRVNYLYFETYNREKDKIVYRNSQITDKNVTKENVKRPVVCARARWKIENGNNNVLKTADTVLNTISGMVRTMPARCIAF